MRSSGVLSFRKALEGISARMSAYAIEDEIKTLKLLGPTLK